MKSTIKFDLTEENQPCLVLDYQDSEDVRDKIVKKFIEGVGFNSSWLGICPYPLSSNKRLITPVGDTSLMDTVYSILIRLKSVAVNSIEEEMFNNILNICTDIINGKIYKCISENRLSPYHSDVTVGTISTTE